MTGFDPDRIAALADGSLDPAEAEAFERAVAADPGAAAELASQRLALAALREAPQVLMSTDERTRLRAAVAAEIGIVRDTAAEPGRSPGRRRIPWPGIAVAAASLVAIVAVVPSIGLFTSDDDTSTAETFVLADEARDLDLPAPAATEADGALQTEEASPLEPADEEMLEAGAAPTTVAATTTIAAAFRDETVAAEIDPALKRILDDPTILAPAADDSLIECRDEAVALLGEDSAEYLAAAVQALDGGGEAIVWFVPSDDGPPALVAFSPDDCTLLYSAA
jgi:hypothetical protein